MRNIRKLGGSNQSSRQSLDFPELVLARVELSSKGKLVYLNGGICN